MKLFSRSSFGWIIYGCHEKTTESQVFRRHFSLFAATISQLKTIENVMYTLHPNIKITNGVESNNAINFLDLTITSINNKLEFYWYKTHYFNSSNQT